MAKQPVGLVVGTITMQRAGARTESWRCSRHEAGTRTQFWETVYIGQQEVVSRVTDEIWSREDADAWIGVQVSSRLKGGFKIIHTDGKPVPTDKHSSGKQVL